MSLVLLRTEPRLAKAIFVVLTAASVLLLWFSVRWHFANAVASKLDEKRPESKLVIDWLIGLGPTDPQTHYSAAAIFEKTFDPNDLQRSLLEYETAAALSPHNYRMWVNLGRARNLNGDVAGTEAAFMTALELAPNYSQVQWAYGNFLIREGRTEEGFRLASMAAEANVDLAQNAVALALQLFDGDISRVRTTLGDGPALNAAMVTSLAAQERFADAVDSWKRLPIERRDAFGQLGEKLFEQLLAKNQYRLAAQVLSDLDPEAKPEVGVVSNSSFENGVKLRGARTFEWQIADGTEPQIALSESQKRTGKFGLLLVFNSFEASQFRTFSQTIAVVPDTEYEFEGFYRSDLKTAAVMKLEIAEASTGNVITATNPLALAGDWARVSVRFKVPGATDGITIRLVRENCTGSACRIAGRLSFDDLTIHRIN